MAESLISGFAEFAICYVFVAFFCPEKVISPKARDEQGDARFARAAERQSVGEDG
jgi:hypothetical protein